MSVAILVATPHTSFGELLQISLEENGQYQVRLVKSGKEARENLSRGFYQMAILDSAINDEPFVQLCKQVLELQKGIRLVVIPPENNVNHSSLGDLIPHGYINRPFYLPDLIETVSGLLNEKETQSPELLPLSPSTLPWLKDSDLLQSYLAQEFTNTQAIAGLIATYTQLPGSSELCLKAGQISPESTTELINLIFRYWNNDENTDLMRFIRLVSDKKDYLVYATRMKGNLILIMAYDSKAPLSVIRPQTKNLAQVLSSLPPKDTGLTGGASPGRDINQFQDIIETEPHQSFSENQPIVLQQHPIEMEPQPAGQEHHPAEPVQFPQNPKTQDVDDILLFERVQSSLYPGQPEIQDDGEPDEIRGMEQVEIPNLSALLGSFPPPDPDQYRENEELPKEEPVADLRASLSEWRDWHEGSIPSPEQPETKEKTRLIEETLPRQVTQSKASPPSEGSPSQPEISRLVKTPPLAIPKTEQDQDIIKVDEVLFPAVEPEVNTLEDTRPHVVAALTNFSQLEPISPALSQINYTCVLLPRLPQHYLAGDLADRLGQWVQQICLAYGWRLEGISIRPEYLQWSVQVAPSISPGNLVRIIRQRTSLNIFSRYTHFREENPSGDYWASGYLIVSGAQPPSAQLLREYISQTRKRQGVIK